MSTVRRSVHRARNGRPPRRRATVAVLALLASVCTGTAASVLTPAVASAGTGADGLGYTPVTPCRVAATTATTQLAAGETRSFRVAGSGAEFAAQGGTAGGCGIPDGVPAVVVSITAVDPVGNGFLRVFPASSTEPNATFINYTAGTGITNTGAVKLATAGALDLKVAAHTNDTDVVIDVQGYYSASSAVNYRAVSPCRVLNTAAGAGTPFAPNESRQIQVAGSGATFAAQGGNGGGCGIPDGANAVEVSITAVGPSGAGFVRTAKAGTADAAMKGTLLNYTSAQNITNTATVDLAASGTLDLKLRNFGATTDLVVDVQGFYSTTNTGRFVPVTPCRVLNTRARDARLPANGARGVHVSGTFVGLAAQGIPGTSAGCGIDDDATAVMASVTAVDPDGDGFVRAWPTGTTPPTATMLNYADGRPITNTGALALAGSGSLDLVVRNFVGSADLVVDAQGYFAPAADSTRSAGLTSTLQTTCQQRDLAGSALFSGASVRCWGANGSGQLGNNSTTDSATPVDASVPFGGLFIDYAVAQQVDGGLLHTCAVNIARTISCWGSNAAGELGRSTAPADRALMPGTVPGISTAIQVSAGVVSTCATLADGTARCWGAGGAGQLGNGGTSSSTSPVAVSGIEDAVQVSTNANVFASSSAHGCALRETGTVLCWGGNSQGQLGNGTTSTSTIPVTVSGLVGATQITTGDETSCALVRGGAVKCWGRGTSGQLGNGAVARQTTPVTVLLALPAVKVEAGISAACALLIDGKVQCWGSNLSGRLGDGTTTDRSTPVTVTTTRTVLLPSPLPSKVVVIDLTGNTDLTTGPTHACTTAFSTGTIRCWGANGTRQLGDGTTTSRSRAVTAQGL